LAIRPGKPLAQLEAHQKGWIQAQNPASVQVVRLLQPEPDERVLDLCSGNGIKAAQLARLGAKVVSVELEPNKVEAAKKNLSRLGFRVEHHVFDLRKIPALEPASKVLLDAPCSGTGTLRGHPEIKLRLKHTDWQGVCALQRQLLTTAATLTQPGGSLVYAVCALTAEEGHLTMDWFLKEHQDFRAISFALSLPHHSTKTGSYSLPFDGLDGFFIAKLERQ
jgi:16S rRNA (cytosine967-C5)-methyltransferase